MNKTISLIAIVTGLVLTSCGSLQTISFEQLQAADVSFPDAVSECGCGEQHVLSIKWETVMM